MVVLCTEAHLTPYLFKLRQTKNVRRLLERAMIERDWEDGGQGFEGKSETLRLMGWSRERRLPRNLALMDGKQADQSGGDGQLALSWIEIVDDRALYEYAVLVTSLDEEVLGLAQLYRVRIAKTSSMS